MRDRSSRAVRLVVLGALVLGTLVVPLALPAAASPFTRTQSTDLPINDLATQASTITASRAKPASRR